MNRDILLVVESPVVASMLSQHLTNVDVCAFGTTMLGGHYTAIIACDPLNTPQAQNWWEHAIRARYSKAAMYFAGHNVGPLSNMPQPQEQKQAVVLGGEVEVLGVVAFPHNEPVDREPMSPLPPPVAPETTE